MSDPVYRPRSLYLPSTATLVIADLHIGIAAESAVDRSLGERPDLATRIGAAVADTSPDTLVIAGDFLHAFDGIPDGVPGTIDAIQAAIGSTSLVVTPGNHDGMLSIVASDIETTTAYQLDDGTVICHGHVEPSIGADRYIIGHDHPTLIVEGDRHPCFLSGPTRFHDAHIIMLPSFSRFPRGTPVGKRDAPDLASPLITDLGACRPIVVADTVHKFPPLTDLRPHL